MKLYKPVFLLLIVTQILGCQKDGFIEKPNILFIFTDDQRFNTINALGDQQLITPNLDRLAESGVTFTHSYNMGAWHGAVCVASRAMLNTGLSVWRAREAEKDFAPMVANRQFWSQRMQDLGYETYFSGKWHVKTDVHEIFDHVSHVRPGMPNQVPKGYNRPKDSTDFAWVPWDTLNGGYWTGGKHWSEVLADDARDFLAQAAVSEKPFFMYLAFNAPHDPRQSPKEFVDKYPLENLILPVSFLSEYPFKDSMGCSASLRDEALAPFPRTPFAINVNQQEYFALITHTDEQIGKIVKALEDNGLKDKTYIFMTADHGLAVGHHGLVGKQNMFDHSLRVPLIISGPGMPEGELRSQQVYLQDIMPTTLSLAGADDIQSVEFNSLIPMITRPAEKSRYESVYGCYMNLQRMVRTDRYKLIFYPKVPVFLLFDVENDPEEMTNLADQSDYQEVLREMKDLLLKQQTQMGDPLDLSAFL